MAVVLGPEQESTWLHGSVEEALDCCEPVPADDLTAYPVSTRVNDPRNDDSSLVERADGSA
jgi:putative SOS response-associated peptidase YedK